MMYGAGAGSWKSGVLELMDPTLRMFAPDILDQSAMAEMPEGYGREAVVSLCRSHIPDDVREREPPDDGPNA